MKKIHEKRFLELIEKKGIIIDSRYPETASLCFKNVHDLWRFWEVPEEADRIPYYVEAIIDILSPWKCIYVWKHLGSWSSDDVVKAITNDVQSVIYRGIGIPKSGSAVLKFIPGELSELATLIFNQLVFGWNVADDLYIIPDHGKQIVKTDHHDVVHIEFMNESDMNTAISKMAAEGFELPVELPDDTFKQPDWIE